MAIYKNELVLRAKPKTTIPFNTHNYFYFKDVSNKTCGQQV